MSHIPFTTAKASTALIAAAALLTAVLESPGPDASGARGAVQAQAPAPGSARDPNASLSCYTTARDQLQLADRTAFLLCNGAGSAGPVQCYKAARDRTMLMDWQIVNLCRCASSAAPVTCVERGRSTTFLINDQLVQLCSATTTEQLRANCAPFVTPAPAPP